MGRETWLGVFSHGYDIPADGFGNCGVRFTPKPSDTFKIEIDRKQIGWLLTSPDDPIHLFEGTYTTSFTDNKIKTPRYEYNQILYRLDLDDPALKPAQQDQPNNNTKSKYPHVKTNRNR